MRYILVLNEPTPPVTSDPRTPCLVKSHHTLLVLVLVTIIILLLILTMT